MSDPLRHHKRVRKGYSRGPHGASVIVAVGGGSLPMLNRNRPDSPEDALRGFRVRPAPRGRLSEMLQGAPEWANDAECIAGPFAELDETGQKAVCGSCPVRAACLAYAVAHGELWGTWGGLTYSERARLCPVCGAVKPIMSELGCDPGHTLLMVLYFIELERGGDPEVRVGGAKGRPMRPTCRTNPDCTILLGQSHSTAAAYNAGCRCDAARAAKLGRAS